MSRYNSYSGGATNGNNSSSDNSGDYDDTTVKLQKHAALSVTGQRVNAFDGNYGDKFVVGFTDARVLDGVVMQRDDKPDTWKVFGFGKFKGIAPDENGVPHDDDGEELSAQDILDNKYVQGFSETFGGDDYYYTPVGVAIEQTDDVATEMADEADDGGIEIGEISMLLSNKSWVRKLGKLITSRGDDFIRTETNEYGNEVAVSDNREWFSTHDPTLREGLESREMELFIIEESFTPDDSDDEITYSVPVLLDAATGERITMDNSTPEQSEAAEAEPAPATDGGTKTEDATSTDTESPETTESPSTDDENVPDVLDDLIDYFARTEGEDTDADDLREMAADEVDVDSVDWDAAVAMVYDRA